MFKITLETQGWTIGSTEINLGLILNEIYSKNSITTQATREFKFEECDGSLEILILPNLKGKCDNVFQKPIH